MSRNWVTIGGFSPVEYTERQRIALKFEELKGTVPTTYAILLQ